MKKWYVVEKWSKYYIEDNKNEFNNMTQEEIITKYVKEKTKPSYQVKENDKDDFEI